MRKRKIETAELLLCCMVLLLGLIVSCLLQLHHDVKALEQEIQAVEERAMEREMHLASAKTAKTAAVAPVLCAAEEEPVVHETETAMYPWPEEETEYVLRVLSYEVGDDRELAYAVVQCLVNTCNKEGLNPKEAVIAYRYTKKQADITDAVTQAWDDVMCSGVTVAGMEDALYFYAPRYCSSPWHESQRFVAEVNGIRFFGEVKG